MYIRQWIALFFSALLLSGCGGALEQRKQQVKISVSPSQQTALTPGETLVLSAAALAYDDKLVEMKWTLQPASAPAKGPAPVLQNADCANGTLTVKKDDARGNCSVTLSIPADADPMLWRVGVTAKAEKKGSAGTSVLIEVLTPPRPESKFRLQVPSLVNTNAFGEALLSYQLLRITAKAEAALPISALRYNWTQKAGPAGGAGIFAGADSATLQFIPRLPGEYQVQVEAKGVVNGREETAVTNVLIIVGDSRSHRDLVVNAGPIQRVKGEDTVTLSGSATYNAGALNNPRWRWRQIMTEESKDYPVTLVQENSPKPHFIAPRVEENLHLTFELVVEDNVNGRPISGRSRVVIVVHGSDPKQEAKVLVSASEKAEPGKTVELKATATYNNEAITEPRYTWTQTSGAPTVTLTNPNSAAPSFTAPHGVAANTPITFEVKVKGFYKGREVSGSSVIEVILNPS